MDDVRSFCSFILPSPECHLAKQPVGIARRLQQRDVRCSVQDIDCMVIGKSLLRRKVADASAYIRVMMKPKYPGFDCRWQDPVPLKCLSLL